MAAQHDVELGGVDDKPRDEREPEHESENEGEDRLLKTRGWYLHKAFKWYATLARLRGLDSLEEDLLYQYEHFRGAEAELSYLARYRYYARLTPIRTRLDDVDRDLARAASVAYARARNSKDPLIGQKVSVDSVELILLEMLPESFAGAARRLLLEAESSLPGELKRAPAPGTIRFADNLAAPRGVHIDGQGQVALIPGEWSMVFCDSYIGRRRSARLSRRCLHLNSRRRRKSPMIPAALPFAEPLAIASLPSPAKTEVRNTLLQN